MFARQQALACVALGLAAIAICGGCQAFTHYHAPASRVIVGPPPPTELDRVSLPAYRIEPPDQISLEFIKLVPRPPYHIDTFDVLMIQVIGTLYDQPINDYYLVSGEGKIELGPAYGQIRIAGMTIEEAREAITNHLKAVLSQPEVLVSLARTGTTEAMSGVYLVGPDGAINLRQYGSVRVAGMTLMQAKLAVEEQLSLHFDGPQVALDMAGYNSKVYYIITQGAGLGDSSVRLPITGNETVLDAISQVGGLSQLSSKTIYVARAGSAGLGCAQNLPVDWDAVAMGQTATNWQLMPGDRVYIVEDAVRSGDNTLAKNISPLERILGVTSVGTSAIRNLQTLGRSYNQNRN